MPNIRESEYFGGFTLSVTKALRDQLLERLDELDTVHLGVAELGRLERRGGVYQLFQNDVLVYVGSSVKDLPGRLENHRKKLLGRQGGLSETVSFRCVYVDADLDAVAPEKMLIGSSRTKGTAEWNTNGFGNKDPGKNRDHSLVERGHFDRIYPIDLSTSVELDIVDGSTAMDVFTALKKALPFNLRFGQTPSQKKALSSTAVGGLSGCGEQTVDEWLSMLLPLLPSNWDAVAFPGYITCYDDINPLSYASRLGYWASDEGSPIAQFIEHRPEFADEEVSLTQDPE